MFLMDSEASESVAADSCVAVQCHSGIDTGSMSFLMTLLKQQLGKALELLIKERGRREKHTASGSQELPLETAALRAELQDSDRSSTPRLAATRRPSLPGALCTP